MARSWRIYDPPFHMRHGEQYSFPSSPSPRLARRLIPESAGSGRSNLHIALTLELGATARYLLDGILTSDSQVKHGSELNPKLFADGISNATKYQASYC
ncbi:hypothetical protein E2562_031332 [Oryza meyeriana var. granulata]|uniref:Uncharacterized protein n=1 Tax=Oryza meyeriana var. granulata TaxID=110450 RepID=A0A6G1CB53_9ORYZ|nr:hypothetical protein E2562_031332 [Oryza meyeriana var. granulata]